MPAGRPTKYCDEIVEKAQEYLDGGWARDESVIPSHVGLALYLDVHRSTVIDWADDKEKPEFSYICDKIMAKQHQILASKGLSGDFNSTITKLMLTKHSYSDKIENDNTHKGPNGEPLTVEIVTVKTGK